MKNSPFRACFSALNSQHRLFIYFSPLSLFVTTAVLCSNLATRKKLGEKDHSHLFPSILSIISFDEAKYVRLWNFCCVGRKCLNHFTFSFPYFFPCVSENENYSCPWVKESAWRYTKKWTARVKEKAYKLHNFMTSNIAILWFENMPTRRKM